MDALTLLRIQARANRLANVRLHGAMSALTADELQAPCTAFFPTLMATSNHIVGVDEYDVGVLHGQAGGDARLIAWLDAVDSAALERTVHMPRGGRRVQRDAAAHMLAHLFMHQTHHRGQLHAMLSGTGVAPPQVDEFLMPSEPHMRAVEMAALGWHEAAVYGALPLESD